MLGKLRRLATYIAALISSPLSVYLLGEWGFRFAGFRKGCELSNLSEIKNVLVVRLDEIGDLVLTTPFLRELRRNFPLAFITLVVKPSLSDLFQSCPYVNEVVTFDWSVDEGNRTFARHYRSLALASTKLWKKHYDLAIVPRWDIDYYHGIFLTYFSGARFRVGYSERVTEQKRLANRGFNKLLTHIFDDNSLKHEVEHNLDMIRFLGGTVLEDHLELWLNAEYERIAREIIQSDNVDNGGPVVAFAPGAGHAKRVWPIERFMEIGIWLQNKYNACLLVVGGKEDTGFQEELRKVLGPSTICVAGQTNLRQTAALLKYCRLFVGTDSGPMHLASAVGTPVIEISCHPKTGHLQHYNSPERFGPWKVPTVVLQPEKATEPCSEGCRADKAHCILEISIESVQNSILELMKDVR